MKADALNPRELFGTTVHYEIPAFQRPYVWTLDDQWQPLWQDVGRVAEKVIAADGDEARGPRVRHDIGRRQSRALPRREASVEHGDGVVPQPAQHPPQA